MKVICHQENYYCPCLNIDYEQGEYCNLNYTTQYLQTGEIVSYDCELVIITYIKNAVLEHFAPMDLKDA